MDQARRYWIWEKRNNHVVPSSGNNIQESTTNNSSYDESSWEEQAFAEDAAGGPGGCIWPPRCYSCSFCRREFRSAQALGGHMNVHRRDRARLKQSNNLQNEIIPGYHNSNQNHFHNNSCNTSEGVAVAHPSQVCSLIYNNPNPIPINFDVLLSPPSESRVSVPPVKMNSRIEQSLASSSNNVQKQHKRSRFESWSNCDEGRYIHISNPAHETEEENKYSQVVESGPCRNRTNNGKPDLSVTLNLFVYHTNNPSISAEDNEEMISRKRRRSDSSTVLLSKETGKVDIHHIQTNIPNLGPFNDLDLELRIGQPPEVN